MLETRFGESGEVGIGWVNLPESVNCHQSYWPTRNRPESKDGKTTISKGFKSKPSSRVG